LKPQGNPESGRRGRGGAAGPFFCPELDGDRELFTSAMEGEVELDMVRPAYLKNPTIRKKERRK